MRVSINIKRKALAIAAIICCLTAVASAQPKGSVLIKDGTVLTITNGTIDKGDVLIEDGVITKIGNDVSAPRGVQVVDASGKYVMPGIIDPHSHIAGVDINEATNPVTAEVKMENSINPNDIAIYHSLAGGVTSILLLHGSANVIGGESQILKLRYGQGQDGMIFKEAPRVIKFALGENPTRVHGQGSGIRPRTRMGVEQVIRKNFDAALDYRRRRNDYLDAKEKYDGQGAPPKPVAKNLRYETLADVIEGKVLVHCHSYRSDEILMLMRVFNDYGIKHYTFTHANEGFKVATELKENHAYASVFSDWWAYKFEVYYSTAYNASILNANGVVTSINSDDDELQRHLNHEAAKTLRYGNTSKTDALKMITLNPAIQLGIDDMVGSLEVGKQGDISIWNKHPLSIYSINQMTFIDGVKYFDRANDPDDMRLDIDPTESYDEVVMQHSAKRRDIDACMHDTFYLFSESNSQ